MAPFEAPNEGKLHVSKDIQGLIKDLDFLKKWQVRKAAIEALVNIGAPAVEPLITALESKDFHVWADAAKALGKIGDLRAIPSLINVLNTAKKFHIKGNIIREPAEDALVKMGSSAVEPLISALSHEDKNVCIMAVSVLGKIGDRRALAPLMDSLHDGEGEMRQAVVAALGVLGDNRAMDVITKCLKDENRNVQKTAARTLDKIGWEPGEEDAAGATYWIINRNWDRCVQIGEPAVGPLISALSEADNDVCISIGKTLGQIGDPQSVQPLIEALRNKNKNVCTAAAIALGQIGDADSIEPLIETLKDKDLHVHEVVIQALEKFGETAVEPLIAAFKGEDRDVRGGARDVLLKIGEPAVEPFIALLEEEDAYLRRIAAESLVQIYTSSNLNTHQKKTILALRSKIINNNKYHLDYEENVGCTSRHEDTIKEAFECPF
jgi:HEAT repeat protein